MQKNKPSSASPQHAVAQRAFFKPVRPGAHRLLVLMSYAFVVSALMFFISCYLGNECETTDDCRPGDTKKICLADKTCGCEPNSVYKEYKPGTKESRCVNYLADSTACGDSIANAKPCPADARACLNGACVKCKEVKGSVSFCDGICFTDLQTNPKHCGSCKACPEGYLCRKGECECPSKEGYIICSNVCYSGNDDPNNCGSCNTKCAAGQNCISGKCQACKAPEGQLCGANKDICILKSGKSKSHCGGCDKACQGANKDCCPNSNFGACVDLTKPENCGSCGNKCGSGQRCDAGTCVCNDKIEKKCNNKCTNLSTSVDHCGKCDNKCPGKDAVCVKAVCCTKGSKVCNINKKDFCIDINKDPNNCGDCGKGCKQGELCVAGKCGPCTKDADCPKGLTCTKGACLCGKDCGWANKAHADANSVIKPQAIAVDTFQNIYVTGSFKGTAIFGKDAKRTLTAAANEDVFVAKISPNGVVLAVWQFGDKGGGTNSGKGIAVGKNGTVFVTGTFQKTITLTSPVVSKGDDDVFVMALDGNGKVLSALTIGGAKILRSNAIALDGKGKVYITGEYSGAFEFNKSQHGKTTDGTKLLVASFAFAGNKLSFGDLFKVDDLSHGKAIGNAITVNSNGDVFVAGECDGKIGDLDTSTNTLCVIKLKSDLKVAPGKDNVKGFKDESAGTGITLDTKGNPYVTGRVTGSSRVKCTNLKSAVISPKDGSDMFTAWWLGTAKNIEFDWCNHSSSGGADEGVGIFYFDKKLYVGGNFTGTATFGKLSGLKSLGKKDIFVVEIDDKGDPTWSISAGSTEDDKVVAVTTDQFGGIYVLGTFGGDITIKDKKTDTTLTKTSPDKIADFFVWKVVK